VKALTERKNELNRSYQDKQQLLFHMGKGGFKTYLANMSILNIQNLSNYYLNKFDTNLSVEISGYKLKKDGDISDKITIHVVKVDTGKQGLFKQYSGGEKGRVALAGVLALHSLINNTAEHGKGFNFLAIDEAISYLDDTGQVEALRILEKSEITSLVVMQQVKNLSVTDKVIFVKQGGQTTIKAA
jgi:DNA repair exonuclease SbcCD ATPase subunit